MFDSSVEEQAVITGYRLSPRQKELWPLAREGAAYVAQLAVRIEGEFDAALEWQTKAVQTAKDEPQEVRAELESRIPLYKARKPYREEPKG